MLSTIGTVVSVLLFLFALILLGLTYIGWINTKDPVNPGWFLGFIVLLFLASVVAKYISH